MRPDRADVFQTEKYPDLHIVNLDKLTCAGNPDNLKGVEDDPRYAFIKGDICDPSIVRGAMKKADRAVHNSSDYMFDGTKRHWHEALADYLSEKVTT
jgi:dTDP-glucose 4,6-dehydratase